MWPAWTVIVLSANLVPVPNAMGFLPSLTPHAKVA
jgi:hypothetical protein